MHRYSDPGLFDRLIAASPPSASAATVLAYLSKNYPASVLGWVTTPGIVWTKRTVSLADVQYARRVGGARDDDKTVAIQKKVEAGDTMEPVVLVAGGPKLVVADGYHRTLAYDRAGKKSIVAWVGTGAKGFDAVRMHAAKKNTAPVAAQQDTSDDVSPIDNGTPIPTGNFPGERFPTAKVTFNGTNGSRELNVGVANTPASRALGMQALPDAGYNQAALLMSWPYDTTATLQNSNVPIPVHASFYDTAGVHAGQFSMAAGDRSPMTAPAPHRYALELHPDLADSLGVGPGCSISLPEELDQTRNGSVGFGGPKG